MYNLMDSVALEVIPFVYCTSIVFICAFFMLNLLLAVIMESYRQTESMH